MTTWLIVLAGASAIAITLVGGVFLAFSDFIMRSLSLARPPAGVEVMQTINREVFRFVFMTLFLGMAAVSLVMAIYAAMALSGTAQLLIVGASLIYLIGVFGVTVGRNVPLNDALAGKDTDATTTQDYWTEVYLPRWTFWNTVRTFACVLSAALLMVGIVAG